MTLTLSAEQPDHYLDWLMQPGLELLSPHDPFIALTIGDQFATDTGLDRFSETHRYEVVSTAVSPMPFPVSYPNDDGSSSRFVDLNPAAAGCPLFWLPEDLRAPALFTNAQGDPELEAIEEWQTRVGLEIIESGLYDAKAGRWVDVLRTYANIDVTTNEGRERVAAYLAGGDDQTLDQLPERVGDRIASTGRAQVDPLWAVQYSLEGPLAAEKNMFVYAMMLNEHLGNGGANLLDGAEPVPGDVLARAVLEVATLFLAPLDATISLADGTQVPVIDYLGAIKEEYDHTQDAGAMESKLKAALAAVVAEGYRRYPDDENTDR